MKRQLKKFQLEGFPSKKEIIKAEKEIFPLVLSPSVSALCNLRCIYCYTRAGKKLPGELDFADHAKAINEFTELNRHNKYMIIAMMGETFLDKSLYNVKGKNIVDPITKKNFVSKFPIIDYANRCGIKVVFFTNTTVINKKIAEELKGKNVSIIGKLNTLNPKLQEEMTGGKGFFVEEEWVDYEYLVGGKKKKIKIPKGLNALIEAGFNKINERGNTSLGVDIILTEKNYKDVPKVVEFCLENFIHPVLDTMLPIGSAAENYFELKLKTETNRWLYKRLLQLLGSNFAEAEFTGNPCSTFRAGIAYDNFGNVRMCCGGEADGIGNIKRDSLKDIYQKMIRYKGNFLSNLRENKLGNDVFPECPVANYFRKELEKSI